MKHCLIVDDSRVIRKVSRHIVESFAFEVTEAENGQDALAKCGEAMPDLILLDWNMPVMNGIEFLHALRGEFGADNPAVVFCTTENEMGRIVQAIEGGANEYIMKPFDAEIIQSKLAQVGLL